MTPCLAKLRKICESATEGPWRVDEMLNTKGATVWGKCSDTGSMMLAACGHASFDQRNAQFIAQFNPEFMLRLLSALETQQKALQEIMNDPDTQRSNHDCSSYGVACAALSFSAKLLGGGGGEFYRC